MDEIFQEGSCFKAKGGMGQSGTGIDAASVEGIGARLEDGPPG